MVDGRAPSKRKCFRLSLHKDTKTSETRLLPTAGKTQPTFGPT